MQVNQGKTLRRVTRFFVSLGETGHKEGDEIFWGNNEMNLSYGFSRFHLSASWGELSY